MMGAQPGKRYAKVPCPICHAEISIAGFAQDSHMRMHERTPYEDPLEEGAIIHHVIDDKIEVRVYGALLINGERYEFDEVVRVPYHKADD
jgi:hypothetical protein